MWSEDTEAVLKSFCQAGSKRSSRSIKHRVTNRKDAAFHVDFRADHALLCSWESHFTVDPNLRLLGPKLFYYSLSCVTEDYIKHHTKNVI